MIPNLLHAKLCLFVLGANFAALLVAREVFEAFVCCVLGSVCEAQLLDLCKLLDLFRNLPSQASVQYHQLAVGRSPLKANTPKFFTQNFFFVLSVFVSFLTCLENLTPKLRFWVHYKSGCGKLLCISNFTNIFSTKVMALGRKSHDFGFSKTTLPNRRNHIHSKEQVVESSPA